MPLRRVPRVVGRWPTQMKLNKGLKHARIVNSLSSAKMCHPLIMGAIADKQI